VLNVYCTGHKHSVQVCHAFAAGARAPIVPPAPLLRGDVMMYGALRGLLPTLMQAQREGRTWFYADNGYLKPGHYRGHYRITRNALQHDGRGTARPDRWRRLGLTIEPWRRSGRHVVICPPGRLFGALFGFDADQWLSDTLDVLRRHTDRELRVRVKMSWQEVKTPTICPLADDLRDAWALVTHSSNAAVEAGLAGVPVFVTAQCGASRIALTDLTRIEDPAMPDDREEWAAVLAANQWTLAEMREGLCWRMLKEQAE